MKPKIIFQKIKQESENLRKQKSVAYSLLSELTGGKVRHSQTGRPFIDESVDVSISHKNDLVYVGAVPMPYKIGLDVEHIKNNINAELFLKSVVTKTEAIFLEKFCRKNKLSITAGISILWSIKEAFFKCLDYDLKPKRIVILDIDKNNKVKFSFSSEIKQLMHERGLKLCLARATFDEKHVFSQAIMKKV